MRRTGTSTTAPLDVPPTAYSHACRLSRFGHLSATASPGGSCGTLQDLWRACPHCPWTCPAEGSVATQRLAELRRPPPTLKPNVWPGQGQGSRMGGDVHCYAVAPHSSGTSSGGRGCTRCRADSVRVSITGADRPLRTHRSCPAVAVAVAEAEAEAEHHVGLRAWAR